MLVSTIIDKCSQELRDERGLRFTKTSLLLALWEALKQMNFDTEMLKVKNYVIPLEEDKSIYTLPSDFTKLIRVGYGDNITPLDPMSLEMLDLQGYRLREKGYPSVVYSDNLNFYELGVYPIPSAEAIPTTSLVPSPTDGDGAVLVIGASTDLSGHLTLDYLRDVELPSPLTTYSGGAYVNDASIDTELPDLFLDKLYLLVVSLRIKASRNPKEAGLSSMYYQRYVNELVTEYHNRSVKLTDRHEPSVGV